MSDAAETVGTAQLGAAAATPAGEPEVLLRTESLSKVYSVTGRWFKRSKLIAVSNIGLAVRRGEILGLVGESGSGKSTLGRLLVRLANPTVGKVWFEGVEIGSMHGRQLRNFHKRMGVVFQNPYSSLNPRMTVGATIAEPLRFWHVVDRSEVESEVARLLESVALPAEMAERYPHAMSGGQRQRVAIARALSLRPEFVFADEAVSSLDVSAAAGIVNLLLSLRSRLQLTMVFATHDLMTARVVADRIAVMYRGELVELRPTAELFDDPQHDYTKHLLAAQLKPPKALT